MATSITLKRLTNVGGLYRKVDPSAVVDNIWIFTDGDGDKVEILDKVGPYVARLGRITPGSDRTSALQTIINDSSVTEVIFDYGDITINGTLTIPTGKKITFRGNGRLIGTGTINGGIIDANMRKQIFATTLTINPEGLANSSGRFSVIWFGANPTGGGDSQPAIQKTIDTVSANNAKFQKVFLPVGTYTCGKGIVLYKKSGSNFVFFTIDLEGEGSWWQSSTGGSSLVFTNKNSFGIGIQLMKGGSVRNLKISGPFTVPSLTDRQFFNIALADYNDGTVIKTQYAGLFGLVVDPFVNNDANEPVSGTWATQGFPDFTSFYEGGAQSSNSGSTGILFEDLFFTAWDACVCFSPNTFTRNAELIRIRKIQYEKCRIGFCNTQDQEKTNTIQHIAGWDDVHTVFAKFTWGVGTPGVYHVADVNNAGRVNQFIDHVEGGYFASHFERIFSERMGKFGRLTSLKGATVSNSEIGFCNPEESRLMQKNIEAAGVTFKNCTIRYYGDLIPVTLFGQSTYDGCSFEVTPYFGPWADMSGLDVARIPHFTNCYVDSSTSGGGWCGSLGLNSSPIGLNSVNKFISPFGKKKLFHTVSVDAVEYSHTTDYIMPYADIDCGSKTVAKTLNGNIEELVITISGNDKWRWGVGQKLAVHASGLGYIGAVHSVTDTQVVIRHPVNEWVDGTYTFTVSHPIWHHHFSGSTTGGSPTISNVILGHKWLSMANMVGMVVEARGGVNVSLYSRWNIIIAQDGTNFTCLNNFYYSVEDAVFSTAETVKVALNNANLDGNFDFRPIRGDIYKSSRIEDLGRSVDEVVVKSAQTTAAATFKSLNTSAENGRLVTANTTIQFDDEFIRVDTTSGDITVSVPNRPYLSAYGGYWSGKYAKRIRIIKVSADANKVIISAFSGQPISGATTIDVVGQFSFATILVTNAENYLLERTVVQPVGITKDEFTLATDGTRVVPINKSITKVFVKPSSALTGFKIGTTPGGEEIAIAQPLDNTKFWPFDIDIFTEASTTLYFGGISASTDLKLFYE